MERTLKKLDRWLPSKPKSRPAPSENRSVPGLLEWFSRVSPELGPPVHLSPVVEAIERAAREEVRVVISAPPQHGKSTLLLHALVWLLAQNPARRNAYVTYAAQVAQDQMYKARLIAQRAGLELETTLDRWRTPQGGGVVATGIGGPLTGYAVDGLLIVDDYVKNRQEAESPTHRERAWAWFTSTALTRVHPGASVVVVATRWHSDDLAGRLVAQGWENIVLSAVDDSGRPLWPEKRPLEWLERVRAEVGEYDWWALYMGQPRQRGESLVRREWIRYGEPPPREKLRVYQGVDLAISTRQGGDYTAVATVGKDDEGRIWVLDVVKHKGPFHTVLQLIRHQADRWQPERIAIEAVQYQAAVVHELMRTTTLPVFPVRPDRDKVTRFLPLAARYQQGLVWHVPNLPREFEAELVAFPTGRHDDQVDALVYAFMAGGTAVGLSPEDQRKYAAT